MISRLCFTGIFVIRRSKYSSNVQLLNVDGIVDGKGYQEGQEEQDLRRYRHPLNHSSTYSLLVRTLHAASRLRVANPSLVRMCCTWFSAVRSSSLDI
jgi:hypothetical protein